MFPAASPEASSVTPERSKQADRIGVIVVVLLYAALLLALTATHEPWRDEGQAWLWAKALSRPEDFLIIPGEGHPPIFYWVLRFLSAFLSFDQARWIAPAFGIINAALLARLLRGDVLVLFAVLFSNVVLQFWGYYFRPYTLVLTVVLLALLLDRKGRGLAATWVMVVACGLHFLSGFLFAFWLIYRFQKGTPVVKMLAPSALALAFGAVSLISGIGNPEGIPNLQAMPERMLDVLAWPAWYFKAPLLVAIASLGLLFACFHRDRFMMSLLLGMTIFYATATGLVYGRLPWHTGFLLVMTVMAYILAGAKVNRWFLLAFLAPQVVAGIAVVRVQLTNPQWADATIYEAVLADAGAGYDPTEDLVVWPDLILSGTAARRDIAYISANDGKTVGPIDWRSRKNYVVRKDFAERPTPYWLVCHRCSLIMPFIESAGQTATPLEAVAPPTGDPVLRAYRID